MTSHVAWRMAHRLLTPLGRSLARLYPDSKHHSPVGREIVGLWRQLVRHKSLKYLYFGRTHKNPQIVRPACVYSPPVLIVRPLASVSHTASRLNSSVKVRRSLLPMGSSCNFKSYQKVPPFFPGKSTPGDT